MGDSHSKAQNNGKQQGKVVLVIKREKSRIEYNNGLKAKKDKTVETFALSSGDSTDFKDISPKMFLDQGALEYTM